MKEYESVVDNHGNEHLLIDFAQFIGEKCAISINMLPNTIIKFFILGEYKNVNESRDDMIHELEATRGIHISQEIAIKNRLGKWYNSRKIFEDTFDNGKKFKYGALNIGGMGSEKYGDFCVIFSRSRLANTKAVFIKEDSLKYVTDSKVNKEKLKNDVADMDHVPYLAVLKHKEDIKMNGLDHSPHIICNDRDYIESIIQEDLLISHIEKIRINSESYDKYQLYLNNYLTSHLEDLERYIFYDYLHIIQFLKKNGIKLEVVEKDAN